MSEWKECDLNSWEDFKKHLVLLREKIARANDSNRPSSKLLFRGQKDSAWELKTSLERECLQPVTLNQYFNLITAVRPEIESQTGVRWEGVPDYPGYYTWLEELDQNNITLTFSELPGYDYLAYLRHHGFPSPFLDWTRSPYIAAYFAFADAESAEKQVSIYVYWEDVGRGKSYSDKPRICCKGHYVRTHRRHFLQQSQYTFCVVREGEKWQFAPHDKALTLCNYDELDTHLSDEDCVQDLLFKFNIPASEKWKVLKYLDERNINGFSLYGSEEGLMKTLAIREVGRLKGFASKVGSTHIDVMLEAETLRLNQKARFQRMTYEWYKSAYPQNVQVSRISCYVCGNPRIHVRSLMQQTYHREHFCAQCGKTLYYSSEQS